MGSSVHRRRRYGAGSERYLVPTPLIFPQGEVVDLRIQGLAHGGRGVARREGFVFLVDGALPGDLARVRIVRRRPSYAEAETLEILKPSINRVPLRCEHAGSCGGCRWMALSERAQLTAKRNLVVEALVAIGYPAETKKGHSKEALLYDKISYEQYGLKPA